MLGAALHFVAGDEAYGLVATLMDALAPGSYLVITHASAESLTVDAAKSQAGKDVYKQKTSSPALAHTRAEVERFFAGLDLLDPGLAWVSQWRHPSRRSL